MAETYHTLKAFRDDHIGAIHEQDVHPTDDHKQIALDIAQRFGLGRFQKENISGMYYFEDGEILTYFRLTPRT